MLPLLLAAKETNCNMSLAALGRNSLLFQPQIIGGGDGPGFSVGSAQTHCAKGTM